MLPLAPAYAMGAGRPAGAVLTFTNVTAFRASVEQAIYEREYTKAILNTITNPLVVLDAHLRVQSGNRAFFSTLAFREKAHGMALRDLGDEDWKASGLSAALTALASEESRVPAVRNRAPGFPAVGQRALLFDARRVTRRGRCHDGSSRRAGHYRAEAHRSGAPERRPP